VNRRQVLVRASMLPWLSACSPTRRAPDVALPATFCGAGRLSGSDATALAAPHWHLKAQPTSLRLREDASDTSAWGYRAVGGERAHPSGGATHPGPLLRARQGELLAVAVENGLPQPTTVHWHGLRLHNAMDGVPTLTQAPIAPGERYGYRIACRDAGTFWYHPHYATHEQLVRGLAGPLIVDEPEVPEVDSELVWMLADWLVDGEEQLREDFEDLRDISHAGRIGNRITINGLPAMFRDGRDPQPIPLAAGARVRLRLINAASARIFALRFSADAPLDIAVAAFDGMPCPLHRPQDDTVHLAPAQRVDLFITMPDGRLVVDDVQEPSRTVRLRELKAQGPSRSAASGWMRPLPANPWQRPRLQGARELQMVLEGGLAADSPRRSLLGG
jgi:FtsP/CotA-like multicopper oxidase with cupredoxin domain